MEKELIVKWKIKETETAGVLSLLSELAAETKKEKGNLYYAIYQSESDAKVICSRLVSPNVMYLT